MKPILLKAAVYAIEFPLMICIVIGFLLLVALSFINIESPHDEEEEDVRRHPRPKDRNWIY